MIRRLRSREQGTLRYEPGLINTDLRGAKRFAMGVHIRHRKAAIFLVHDKPEVPFLGIIIIRCPINISTSTGYDRIGNSEVERYDKTIKE